MKRLAKSVLRRLARRLGYDIVRRDAREGALVYPAPGRIARFTECGVDYAFFVARPGDLIQFRHAQGTLYEPEELAIIGRYLPEDALFIDIGANVGNHTIHVMKALGARQAVLFEPTLFAHTILSVNLALNGLEERVTVHKFCLSNKCGEAWVEASNPDNWGSARLSALGRGEQVAAVTGDSLLTPDPAAFVKIDVEGHEMAVLGGLTEFIAGCRPPIFAEVDNSNRPEFDAWCAANRYEIAERHRRYETNENLMVRPLG